MRALSPFTALLLISGALITAASIGWWWLTYRDVVFYQYMSLGDASICLVRNTEICQLARTLCRGAHPLALVAYWSASIWFGLAALGGSVVTATARAA